MDELRYERVEGDLFDITERIREIDESYFILRERKSGRLEVHSREQKGSTLAHGSNPPGSPSRPRPPAPFLF